MSDRLRATVALLVGLGLAGVFLFGAVLTPESGDDARLGLLISLEAAFVGSAALLYERRLGPALVSGLLLGGAVYVAVLFLD